MPNEMNQKPKESSKPRPTGFSTSGTSNGGNSRKGKSKYASKSHKKPVKPVAKTPTFSYTSACCSAPATKTPCTKASKAKGATPQSLGTWRCGQCKKVCKVTVSKFKSAEIVQELKASLVAAMDGIEGQINPVPFRVPEGTSLVDLTMRKLEAEVPLG